ncbi:MAG: hypothetical protein KF841_13745 [Phycisphaerae bacterium]|nr:hypothetical protein [Phycisphaerae bacterium]
MSLSFGAHCDDFHIATRLFLKLDLGLERETVLHFFDTVRREFPGMRRLRRREDTSLLLEEDENDRGQRRWLRLDESTLRMGHHNPTELEDARRYAGTILKLAPYHLTLGDLDYDHIEVVFGFDLEYRGNHDQLIAETFFSTGPLSGLTNHPSVAHTIDAQPFMGMALSDRCDTQAYLEIKSRTSTYEVRTGQYESQPLSVFLTVRRFFGFHEGENLLGVHQELTDIGMEWAAERVVPMVIQPLAQAIASRP